MSIEMKNPKTVLEKIDAAANLVEQIVPNMKFKHRLLIWLLAIFLLPILIFIYDGGYNATAMGWIVGVAVLALIVELIYKRLNRKL